MTSTATAAKFTRRRLRLASGLVLFAYLASHLANHAAGLISLDAAEAGTVPADLAAALAAEPRAAQHFAAFSPSARKMLLTWVLAAKRADTRARRVADKLRTRSGAG